MKKLKPIGFTLLELVIVILISGVIAAVVSRILAQGFQAFYTTRDITNANWQGLLALERMARDIREIQASSALTTASSSQLTFTDFNNNSVSYSLSGSSLMRSSNILADGVGGLSFGYFTENGTTTSTLSAIRYISISLTITQNNVNYTFSTAIYPRNLR